MSASRSTPDLRHTLAPHVQLMSQPCMNVLPGRGCSKAVITVATQLWPPARAPHGRCSTVSPGLKYSVDRSTVVMHVPVLVREC